VKEDRAHSKPPREGAGVLASGATEHDERVVAHVVAARDADLADGFGHVGVCDLEKAIGDLLDAAAVAPQCERVRDVLEAAACPLAVQRKEKAVGLQAAEHEIGVGDRRLGRIRVAIAKRTGPRARALRPTLRRCPS